MFEVIDEIEFTLITQQQDANGSKKLIQHDEKIQQLIDELNVAAVDEKVAEYYYEQLQIEIEQSQLHSDFPDDDFENRDVDDRDKMHSKMKQLEEQNLRYKAAFFGLKAILLNDRKNIHKLQSELDSTNHKLSTIVTERQIRTFDIQMCREIIDDLTEQLNSTLNSHELVERLKRKNLKLEDRNRILQKALVAEINLKNMNNMIIGEKNEIIYDLRDEIDRLESKVSDYRANYHQTREALGNQENIIERFHKLVHSLKNEVFLLKTSQIQQRDAMQGNQRDFDVETALGNCESSSAANSSSSNSCSFSPIRNNNHSRSLIDSYPLDQMMNIYNSPSDQTEDKLDDSVSAISNLSREIKVKADELCEMRLQFDIAENNLKNARLDKKRFKLSLDN